MKPIMNRNSKGQ